jgi:RNA recognition motif-containing protein
MHKTLSVTKMVVRNLPPKMTLQSLRAAFSVHGDVRSVSLATDVMTGWCRGLGFVSLDELQTGAALDALNGSRLGGNIIRVSLEKKWGRP